MNGGKQALHAMKRAIGIKRSLAASVGRGLHHARADVKPTRSFVVHAGEERYPLSPDIEAVGVRDMMTLLSEA